MSEGRSAQLSWAVRASLLRYVESSGGVISLAPPAVWTGSHFVFGTPDVQGEDDDTTFHGEVRLHAHGGLLDVQIARPRMRYVSGLIVLSAEDLGGSRRDLARLEPQSSHDGATVFEARLHEDAVGMFGGVYPVGEPLDPLEVRYY